MHARYRKVLLRRPAAIWIRLASFATLWTGGPSHLLIENWVPASGDRETDVRNDREWLIQSLANLRQALEKSAVSESLPD